MSLDLINVSSNYLLIFSDQLKISIILNSKPNGDILLQFPLFNFTLSNCSNLVSINNLPSKWRPNKIISQICSLNDLYLQSFDITIGPPYPNLSIYAVQVTVDTYGIITISNIDGSQILSGTHTFNSQSIYYNEISLCSCSCNVWNKFDVNLQTIDTNGIPFKVPTNEIEIHGKYKLEENIVTIQIQSFSFGSVSDVSTLDLIEAPVLNEGCFLASLNYEFLPKKLRPDTTQTIVQLTDKYLDLGLSGFNISLNTYGQLIITACNILGGNFPIYRFYNIEDLTFRYLIRQDTCQNTCNEFIIQPGFTSVSGNGYQDVGDNIRDGHVGDFHCGILAYCWSDNSDQKNKAVTVTNAYIRIGEYDEYSNMPKWITDPINVSKFPTTENSIPTVTFNTSIAINRTNPNNIVLGIGVVHNATSAGGSLGTYTYYSDDKGKKWNGPVILQDCYYSGFDPRGVVSDKYGNFLYTIAIDEFFGIGEENLIVYTSSTEGKTWIPIFSSPGFTYDYPQIVLGNYQDSSNTIQYGLYILVDYFPANEEYIGNVIGRLFFIPIIGPGNFGVSLMVDFTDFMNQISLGIPTLKEDGTLLFTSNVGNNLDINYWVNSYFVRKPGDLQDQTLLTGPKTIINASQNVLPSNAVPSYGYSFLPMSPVNNLYDKYRKAIYVMFQEQPNPESQDFYLFLIISKDDGSTWSKRYQITTTHHNNRGYVTMSLDGHSKALSVSWYDARNSKKSLSLQYFGRIIKSKELDKLN